LRHGFETHSNGCQFRLAHAEIAVMGPRGRGEYRQQARAGKSFPNPSAKRSARKKSPNSAIALPIPSLPPSAGYIDAIIEPADTRARIITSLRALETSAIPIPARNTGNIPL